MADDTATMTADEFERAYAERSKITIEELRKHRTVRPCRCGDDGCDGWQSISYERAAEYDRADRADHHGH